MVEGSWPKLTLCCCSCTSYQHINGIRVGRELRPEDLELYHGAVENPAAAVALFLVVFYRCSILLLLLLPDVFKIGDFSPCFFFVALSIRDDFEDSGNPIRGR